MPSPTAIAAILAAAFLAGDWELEPLVKRGAKALGKRWRWLRPLIRRTLAKFDQPPRRADLAAFLSADDGLHRALQTNFIFILSPQSRSAMAPMPAAEGWRVSQIHSVGELADWLRLSHRELERFADRRGLGAKTSIRPLQHYSYRPLAKRFGQVRLIEAPKSRLKEIQRQILIDILEAIPVHPAAHGFCAGRSIASFASPHVGRDVVLKIDLQDFFPSIAAARVKGLFRSLGYSESVAGALTGLCTNVAPRDLWNALELSRDEHYRVCSLYSRPHLPQGAPTSPAIANLCAYRLDCRLAAYAAESGGTYTRYADDLAFSGGEEFARGIERFHVRACAIAMEEGFAVHHRKTRIMRPGVRQQLAGLVVNERLNIRRDDYDRLKAILTNCLRHGPATQNHAGHADFRAHLLGLISFVAQIHPARGAKLRALLDRIDWK